MPGKSGLVEHQPLLVFQTGLVRAANNCLVTTPPRLHRPSSCARLQLSRRAESAKYTAPTDRAGRLSRTFSAYLNMERWVGVKRYLLSSCEGVTPCTRKYASAMARFSRHAARRHSGRRSVRANPAQRVQILGNPWAAALPPNPSPRAGRSLHGSVQALGSPAARHRPRPPENVGPAAADGKAPPEPPKLGKRSGAGKGAAAYMTSRRCTPTPRPQGRHTCGCTS